MERYAGRVALVTGASSGIGAAVAQALLRHGLTVVGVDLQPDKMQAWELNDSSRRFHAKYADVTDEESILSVFKWIRDNLGGTDILINNAGVYMETPLTTAATEKWRRILEVNVLGMSVCAREAVQDMLSRGLDDGFIVYTCSIAGHLPTLDSRSAMYSASKAAVSALVEGMRKDLQARNCNIRVGQISPSAVKTNICSALDDASREDFETSPCLEPEDIADAIIFMLSRKITVQVHNIIIRNPKSQV